MICAGSGQHDAQHNPRHFAVPRESALTKNLARHGGPLFCVGTALPGAGNLISLGRVAVTYSFPVLQHGHRNTSILATLDMKARADSAACGLMAGICNARSAAFSLIFLHAGANTP